MKIWITSSSSGNTSISFKQKKWGLKPRLRRLWGSISPGDVVLFYVLKPVGGIVGAATVEGKAEEQSPVWPDEIQAGRALYPYRVSFKTTFLLKEEEWETKRIPIRGLKISVRAGMNSVRNEKTLSGLSDRIAKSWGIKIS